MNETDPYYRVGRTHAAPQHALVQDVFGEWVDPDEVVPEPPPVRLIPVTDALRAQDAAERARREAPVASAWAIKAELHEDNLRKARVERKHAARRVRTLQRKRQGKIAVANEVGPKSVPVEPTMPETKVVEEEKTMIETSEVMVQTCKLEGCGTKLGPTNKSGYCTKHFYYSKKAAGTQIEKKPAPEKRIPEQAAEKHRQPMDLNDVVSLLIPVELLDVYWSRLPVGDKARIVAAELRSALGTTA